MNIVNFTRAHISEATVLAYSAYEEELRHTPILPPIDRIPDLTGFADNGYGFAALDGGKMKGFLCSYAPFENMFGSTYAKGVFSPMGANASVIENRAKIYAAMYQAAADKWVSAGAVSHSVCLYAHDTETQRQFYLYGFGLRCVDAIRPMELIDCLTCTGYSFRELDKNEFAALYPMEILINRHFKESPIFMNRSLDSLENFLEDTQNENSRFFSATHDGIPCAYMQIKHEGETFITKQADFANITGAFCLPEHRGKGVYQNLLNFVISNLKREGYTRLGVDFESFNPTAYGFWMKYFTPYTNGVVRRIDEKILEM